jgi:hypothetical protein
MAEQQFAPHGQYRVFWCDDVLYSELIGTFNEEAIIRYLDEMKALVANRSTRWGRMADMRRWDGGTPAAAALFKGFAEWIKTTQCKVSVQLLPDSFRLAIAANTAQTLNTHHLYQVTDPQQALRVLADYGIEAQGLHALLEPALPPATH